VKTKISKIKKSNLKGLTKFKRSLQRSK